MAQPNETNGLPANPFISDADSSSEPSLRASHSVESISAVPVHREAASSEAQTRDAQLPNTSEERPAAVEAPKAPAPELKKKSVSFQSGTFPTLSHIAPWEEQAGMSSVAMPAAARFRSTLEAIPGSAALDEFGQDIRSAPTSTSTSPPASAPAQSTRWSRRKSSAVGPYTSPNATPPNVASPRRDSFARKLSFFNPFDQTFGLAAQNPIAGEAESESAGAVAEPPRAQLRSQSASAAGGFFRNPFGADGDEEAIRQTRRPSAPGMERRASQFQRMMSVVAEPNPIPERYRSKSVSSLAYFVTPLNTSNAKLPIFEDDIETQKENIQEYLAGVELLQAQKKRKPWQSHTWQGTYFFIILAVIYFVLIGRPIWPGAATLYYRWLRTAHLKSLGVLIFMSWAAIQSFLPLFCRFEQEVDDVESRDSSETALIIPAYKAANVLPETIEHALKIFKPEQIFIVNNGNSEAPLDDTAGVCAKYGVNHAWVPIGSKIVAEFVGVALSAKFKYIMLIDDDVHLPANLPIVTDRINEKTKCIGYTIKSTGENGCKGTIIQQCQDMEYKQSGLTRTFAGKYGSATFPHGAIILWEREVLKDLFNVHPGYTISEDWYFGHAARSSGYRIEFCSQVFVETETPPAFIKSTSAARGGFGEMTVFKQRFGRWNYFFVFRIWEDTIYILFSWRLGFFRELVTKIWVLVEVYDSILAMLRPFVIVITAIAAWRLLLIMTAALMAMYLVSFIIFNSYHLRRKNEMVSWKILPQ